MYKNEGVFLVKCTGEKYFVSEVTSDLVVMLHEWKGTYNLINYHKK